MEGAHLTGSRGAALAAFVAGRLAAGAACVVVVAPADSGVEEATRDLGLPGRAVRRARGLRLEADRPGGVLARLTGRPDAGLEALWGPPAPVVVVDEAQWADPESLAVLVAAAERGGGDGPVVVVTHRPCRPMAAPLAALHTIAARHDALARSTATDGLPGLDGLDDHALDALAEARGALAGPLPLAVATALAFGAQPGDDDLGSLVSALAPGHHDDAALDAALAGAESEGLLHDGRLDPRLGAALRRVLPARARAGLVRALSEAPAPARTVRLGEALAGLGDASPAAGRAMAAAAALVAQAPGGAERAVVLWEHAEAAGAGDPAASAAAWLAAGNPNRALRVLAAAPAGTAGATATAAWAHEGHLAQVAAGAGDAGVRAWAAAGAGLPTLVPPPGGDLLARAVHQWLDGDAGAVATAISAAADHERRRWSTPAAVTPHEVAAWWSSTLGDHERAGRLLGRVDADEPARRRAGLASAFLAARTARPAPTPPAPAAAGRERLVAAATVCASERRAEDPSGLPGAVAAARAVEAEAPLDLHLVDVAAEVDAAASRVAGRCDTTGLDRLEPLLAAHTGAGAATAGPARTPTTAGARGPVGWRVALAWGRLAAALAADDDRAIAAHSVAVADAAADSAEAGHRVMAGAARAFGAVVGGQVDPQDVEVACEALAERGFLYEAGRLAGAAALACDDEATARRLLKASRMLRARMARLALRADAAAGAAGAVAEAPAATAGTAGTVGTVGASARVGAAPPTGPLIEPLSEREEAVARLVLAGRTHKEIGAELFISAKTVEHHVAHIRTKLGALTRAEMLSAVREWFALKA